MTIRLDMLRTAERAKGLLGDSSNLVVDFVRGQLHEDGGFKGRGKTSDLYYTVFGMECLLAMGAELPVPSIKNYLHSRLNVESLDLVHLACLARCFADLPGLFPESKARQDILDRIEACRCGDGGYGNTPADGSGTIYHGFLALCAYQDLRAVLPAGEQLIDFVHSRATADGGFGIEEQPETGTTPVTAAAVMVLAHLGAPPASDTAGWLRERCHSTGGFLATPSAPVPDLLSTATALHALTALGVSMDDLREDNLDFIDGLWSGTGGFRGLFADEMLDCEYTFYGLLALGHLAG